MDGSLVPTSKAFTIQSFDYQQQPVLWVYSVNYNNCPS